MRKPLLEILADPKWTDYQLYCDMDGVLTNFEKRFEEISGGENPQRYEAEQGKTDFWKLISKEGVRFWSDMEWMPGGKELWDYIKDYEPILLTAPSREQASKTGKTVWVSKNLSPIPKIIFADAKDKQKYAKPNAILIDDRKQNIEQWKAAGGIGIRCLYGEISPIFQKLKELGYD